MNLTWDELTHFFEFVEVEDFADKTTLPPWSKRLPRDFRLFLLPQLQNATPAQIHQYIRYFWAFDLNHNRSLLAGISRMACSQDHAKTLSWCDVLQYQQPNRRSAFVTLLVNSGVFDSFSGDTHSALWQSLLSIEGKTNYSLRLWALLIAVKRKVNTEYILAGLQVVSPSFMMRPISSCRDFPMQCIRRFDAYVKKTKGYYSSFAYELWQNCGRLKGFGALLKSLKNHQALRPEECFEFLEIFCDAGASDWKLVRESSLVLWKNLVAIPGDRRMKFIENVRSLIRTSELKQVPDMVILLQRLSADSRFLQISDWFASVAGRLVDYASPHKAALVHAPVPSWLKFDKAYNDHAWTVEDGLERMLKIIPLFTCKAFSHFPNKLFSVAELLGVLPDGMDKRILNEFAHHPLFLERFRKKTDTQIVQYFEANKGFTNPVPRKFQEYAGTLSSSRRKRYRKIVYQNLHLTRLEILEECIAAHLRRWQPVHIKNQNVLHSILILSGKGANNRAAKRFLKAYLSGKEDYILEHPRTLEWLRKHQDLNLSLWMCGLQEEYQTRTFGSLRIEVEQDPFEAWKLGTYVHSCLSLGRMNQQYASAAVLDINKRVLYARNSKRQVIARQLIALSEERTLVCFSVYPVKIDSEIKKLFRNYDRKFADALGIPIHSARDKYTITTILARTWYDDSAWDFSR
ncbi:hypothetical protein L0156_14935 [bacterium]|nr:hypothetical protein [bacterium]